MNWTNIIVSTVILGMLGLAVFKLKKDKQQGKHCSGCSGCPVENQCSTTK